MIRVESITIKEFRGIRDLTLEMGGNSFAICGSNGTGKSGVIDALEFALTGGVSRLSGEGSRDVTLRQHGPHVDCRNDPGKAHVIVKVTIPSLKKTATLERNLRTPAGARVMPSDVDIATVLREVETHPEIVLSRRELIQYVLATPGNRAQEVQALLHLEQVDKVRIGLQKIANSCEKQLVPLDHAVKQASDNLLRVLEMVQLTAANVLAAANAQRALLGLPALAELDATTSLMDGLATPGPVLPQRIPKVQALADLRAAREALVEIAGVSTSARVAQASADLTVLANDPAASSGVTRESFYSAGLALIESGACPLCDTAWDLQALKSHVQAKIDLLKEASLRRKEAESTIAPLIAVLRTVRAVIESLTRHAALATPPLEMGAADAYSISCQAAADKLAGLLPLHEAITVLANVPIVPQEVLDSIEAMEKAIAALPEPTKQDSALQWLSVAQERLEVWRDAMRRLKVAKAQAQLARQVSDAYVAASDSVLTGMYAKVEKDFASLYGTINHSDEDKFQARLVPSGARLNFDVDFYQRGFFPPGAYHSEGHQDAMGLCLYLALMRYLQGTSFTLAVLDDVLMSVDAGHRREVCDLLKREFPDTQFIVTTHDPHWLRHMRTVGLLVGRSCVYFRSWSVDRGPTCWDDLDVWAEMDQFLAEDRVRDCAALLRHYLEYTSMELCHGLRAPVEFRGDATYQLGDLMPAAIAKMRKLYRTAKDAANSWGQQDAFALISAREQAFSSLASTSEAEQWQMNVAVHHNTWENLTQQDFAPVVRSFRNLLGEFRCPSCSEYFRVSPDRKEPEALRCGCGNTNFNLLKKPA